MSEKLIANIKDDIPRIQEHLQQCELIRKKNPFDVPTDKFYKEVEKYNSEALHSKIRHCREAAVGIDYVREYFLKHYTYHTRDDIAKKSCKSILKADINILQEEWKKFLGEDAKIYIDEMRLNDIYFTPQDLIDSKRWTRSYFPIVKPNSVDDWKRENTVWTRVDMNIAYREQMFDMYELRDACQIFIDVDNMKQEQCPLINNNGLMIHYLLNQEPSVHGVDIKSGQAMRTIEKNCIGFPMVKDIPYTKNGKELFRFRILVHEEPDSSGRVGEIRILTPIKRADIDDDTSILYNDLTDYNRRRLLGLVLDQSFGTGFRHPLIFEEKDARVQRKIMANRPLVVDAWSEQSSYNEIGRETCVWAAKTQTFSDLEEEAREQAVESENMDLAERIVFAEKGLASFERLEAGVVDVFPRQTLFDQTVSTIAGWVDFDLAPNDEWGTPFLEPMLSNMLYTHIGKIAPQMLVRHFLKIIEGQVAQGTTRWGWANVWLDRYSAIAEYFNIKDLEYIHNITKVDILEFVDDHVLLDIIAKMPTIDRDINILSLRARQIDKWFELTNTENPLIPFRERMKNHQWRDLWIKHFRTEGIGVEKIPIPDTIGRIEAIKDRTRIVDYEIKITNTDWAELNTWEQMTKAWIEDREAGELGIKMVGLFKSVDLEHSITGGLELTVDDHRGRQYIGWSSTDPLGDLCDLSEYRREWLEMSKPVRRQWIIDNAGHDPEKTFSYNPPEIARQYDNSSNYELWKCPFWNDEIDEYRHEKIVQHLIDTYEDNVDFKYVIGSSLNI